MGNSQTNFLFLRKLYSLYRSCCFFFCCVLFQNLQLFFSALSCGTLLELAKLQEIVWHALSRWFFLLVNETHARLKWIEEGFDWRHMTCLGPRFSIFFMSWQIISETGLSPYSENDSNVKWARISMNELLSKERELSGQVLHQILTMSVMQAGDIPVSSENTVYSILFTSTFLYPTKYYYLHYVY